MLANKYSAVYNQYIILLIKIAKLREDNYYMGIEHLYVLIKPASSLCNMKCRYCFYHDLSESRNTRSYGIMTGETVDRLIDNAVDSADKIVSFAFQGGEPTLAGLDYFRYFIEYAGMINRKSNKNLQINYAIQTNGININDEFAEFFRKNNFLVGLSLDGVKETHDFLRVDSHDAGTHAKIIKTAELFDKHKVEYNILTVITAQTAKHIGKIYNYYKKRGFLYLQFIPCLEALEETPFNKIYSLTPELYEKFLINLFRLWYDDFMSGYYISVRFFDNTVRTAAGYPCEQCGTTGTCPGQFVVESDGGVFPCDFYCVDNWKTGDIFNMTFKELNNSQNMQRFRETSDYKKYSDTKTETEAEKCASCKVYYLCKGGCRRDRDNKKDGTAGGNIYCRALYNFYSFAEPYLKNIVAMMIKNKGFS